MAHRRVNSESDRAVLGLAGAHAILFTLAFPPYGVWPAALLAVTPLAWIAARTDRPRRAAGLVWIVSTVMWLFVERWLIGVTVVGWPLLAAYLGLYPAAFVWLGAKLAVRVRSPWWFALGLAVCWSGLETLRGEVVLTGYAWFLIAHPLIGTPIAQLASWIGVSGVGFIVALAQTLLIAPFALGQAKRARRERRRRRVWAGPILASIGMMALAMGVGAAIPFVLDQRHGVPSDRSRAADRVSVAVVQTNVPQSNKTGWTIEQRVKDYARMRELTLEAAGRGAEGASDDGSDARSTNTRSAGAPAPDLIVWPETMFPGDTLDPRAVEAERRARLGYRGGVPATEFYDSILALQKQVGAPMLVGALGYNNLRIAVTDAGAIEFHQDGKFNSAFLIDHGAVRPERYDKIHLTPFGEVIPYLSRRNRLERLLLSVGASGMAFDLDEGTDPVVFEVPIQAPSASEGSHESHESPRDEAGADADDQSPAQSAAPPERVRIVTPICFEAATPTVCRRLVFNRGRRRADLIINLTNDGWFGSSLGGREQHLQIARWRCIELRTPMVRAANTGVSASIDALGRVQAVGPENRQKTAEVAGVMRALVRPAWVDSTLYARIGDAVGWATLAGMWLMAGVLLFVGRRGKDTA